MCKEGHKNIEAISQRSNKITRKNNENLDIVVDKGNVIFDV